MRSNPPGLVLAAVVPVTVVVVIAVLAVASLFGVLWRRNQGRVRPERSGELLTAADVGTDLGSRATFLQFSTLVCQPCRVTRGVLGGVAADLEGVNHVEIDAELRLDLVRRFNVLRTPTVLLLDERGEVVQRVAGTPRRADMLAAVAAVSDRVRSR